MEEMEDNWTEIKDFKTTDCGWTARLIIVFPAEDSWLSLSFEVKSVWFKFTGLGNRQMCMWGVVRIQSKRDRCQDQPAAPEDTSSQPSSLINSHILHNFMSLAAESFSPSVIPMRMSYYFLRRNTSLALALRARWCRGTNCGSNLLYGDLFGLNYIDHPSHPDFDQRCHKVWIPALFL